MTQTCNTDATLSGLPACRPCSSLAPSLPLLSSPPALPCVHAQLNTIVVGSQMLLITAIVATIGESAGKCVQNKVDGMQCLASVGQRAAKYQSRMTDHNTGR